jgi:hypothetical protein
VLWSIKRKFLGFSSPLAIISASINSVSISQKSYSICPLNWNTSIKNSLQTRKISGLQKENQRNQYRTSIEICHYPQNLNIFKFFQMKNVKNNILFSGYDFKILQHNLWMKKHISNNPELIETSSDFLNNYKSNLFKLIFN